MKKILFASQVPALFALLFSMSVQCSGVHPAPKPEPPPHKLGTSNIATRTCVTTTASWFTAPPNVTFVTITGWGGGGGGGGGAAASNAASVQSLPGSGGGGAQPFTFQLSVTPNTAYDCNIGAGGTGGSAGTAPNGSGGDGNDGGDTSFVLHSGSALITFKGGGKGYGGNQTGLGSTSAAILYGGSSVALGSGGIAPLNGGGASTIWIALPNQPGQGGRVGPTKYNSGAIAPSAGAPSILGWAGGAAGGTGTDSSTDLGGPGGGGGGGGPGGAGQAGGNGGNGNNAGTGGTGSGGKNPAGSVTTAAATGSKGAGGSGGGAGAAGSGGGGNGGAGGGGDSGWLTITWSD